MEDYVVGYNAGYRRHLVGRAVPPVPPKATKDSNGVETVDATEQETYDDLLDDYEHVQASIRNIILSSVSDRIKNRLLPVRNAGEMWKKLKSIYENQSILVKVDLLSQIHSISCPEEGDPLKTIDELVQKTNEYAAAGGILSDEERAAALMKAMPRQYHPTINTLTESIKLDQSKVKREDEVVAMAARFKDLRFKQKRPKGRLDDESDDGRDDIECFNCGGQGHYARECASKERSKKKGMKGKGKGRAKRAGEKQAEEQKRLEKEAEEDTAEVVSDYALSAATPAFGLKASKEGGTIRLLDSAASQHFDPDPKSFISMRDCEPFPIEVATGHIVYAKKIGTIRFPVHSYPSLAFVNRDGSSPTLREVWRNLRTKHLVTTISKREERDRLHITHGSPQTVRPCLGRDYSCSCAKWILCGCNCRS